MFRGALIVICGLLLVGCGGGSSQENVIGNGEAPGRPPEATQPPGAGLPPATGFLPHPLHLETEPPAARMASYTEESLIHHGSEYEALLPRGNVSVDGTFANFTSKWDSSGSSSFEDLAYAIYKFDVSGYDREPVLRYRWATPPDDFGGCWLGLADFHSNRWAWYPAALTGLLYYSDIAPFASPGGNLYVAVVLIQDGIAQLQSIRVGEHNFEAVLTASPSQGLVPLQTLLSANSSVVPAGELGWGQLDLDNDGSYEANTTPENTYEAVLIDPGVHTIRLKQHDSYGFISEDTLEISCAGQWSHTWGLDRDEKIEAVVASQDAFYLVGHIERLEPSRANTIFLKLDLSGQVVFAREWGWDGSDVAIDIALAQDGTIFVAGSTTSFAEGAYDVFVQHWDSDGVLLWSKTWGEDGDDVARCIAVDGSDIYVAGITDSFGDSTDGLLLKYNMAGDLVWARTVGDSFSESINGICTTRWIGVPQEKRVHLTGGIPVEGTTNVLYVRFTDGGSLLETAHWNLGYWQEGQSVVPMTLLGHDTIIGGNYSDGWMQPANCLLLEPVVSGSHTAVLWGGDDSNTISRIIRHSDGFFATGTTAHPSRGGSIGLVIDVSKELDIRSAYSFDSGWSVFWNGFALFPGQGLVFGGFSSYVTEPQWNEVIQPQFSYSSGTWTSLGLESGTPVGVIGTTPTGTEDILGAVLDSGGGNMDACFASFNIPPS